MKPFITLILITAFSQAFSQADKYLASITKYNEASSFEDMRYKGMRWQTFYALEEVKDFVDPMNYDADLMNAALFFAVNKYREKQNLKLVYFDPRLRDAAMIHTNEMTRRNFFDHINQYDPKIRMLNQRTELCGFEGEYLSENIARSFVDMSNPLTYTELAEKVIKELATSKDHKRNMLNPNVNTLGCGFLFENRSKDGYFYFRTTHDFGKRN